MRKTLSVLLSVVMVLSILAMGVVSVGAVEGTAINNAEEFLAMTADGTYYLAADITVSETYVGKDAEGNDVAFTGTFDGNGHTVTVSVPMFKQMNGTVKNLTIEGAIEAAEESKAHIGTIATNSKGGKFYSITNKANITVTVGDHIGYIGGLVGRLNGADTPAEIIDCANYGNITGEGGVGGLVGVGYCTDTLLENCINFGEIANTNGVSGSPSAAGGIIGYSGTGAIHLKKCTNNGAIVSTSNAGGIAGDTRKSSTVTDCINNAEINGGGSAAGIVGYSGGSGITVGFTAKNCVNNGNVTGTGGSTGGAAGIVAYAWASDKDAALSTTLENCVNNGNIHLVNKGFASEFVAYTNSVHTRIVNCIGTGSIDATGEDATAMHIVFVGLSSSDTSKYTVENVFMADGSTITHYSWTATADSTSVVEFSAIDGKDYTDTAKAIVRGTVAEIVEKANTAAGSEVFVLSNDDVSLKAEIGSTLAPAPAVEPEPVPTGDAVVSVVAVAAISLVAVLGIAYTSKKEND